MALASAYLGEAELDTVMDDLEAVAGIDNAEEAVFMGLVAAVVQAALEAQTSTNATNRLGEAFGAHTVMLLQHIATLAPFVRTEILEAASGSSVADLSATDGDNHAYASLGPIH